MKQNRAAILNGGITPRFTGSMEHGCIMAEHNQHAVAGSMRHGLQRSRETLWSDWPSYMICRCCCVSFHWVATYSGGRKGLDPDWQYATDFELERSQEGGHRTVWNPQVASNLSIKGIWRKKIRKHLKSPLCNHIEWTGDSIQNLFSRSMTAYTRMCGYFLKHTHVLTWATCSLVLGSRWHNELLWLKPLPLSLLSLSLFLLPVI